jgi:hypothetical protein
MYHALTPRAEKSIGSKLIPDSLFFRTSFTECGEMDVSYSLPHLLMRKNTCPN